MPQAASREQGEKWGRQEEGGKGKEGGNWEGETPKTWVELETKKIVANNTFCQKVPIL